MLECDQISFRQRMLISSIFTSLLLAVTTESPALGITLKDVCAESMRQSKKINASKEWISSARFKLRAVRAERWPSLNLTSNVGISKQQPASEFSTNQRWNNSAGLEFTWNIWDGGIRGNSEDLEELNLTKAEQQALIDANNTIKETAEAYMALHRALLAKRNHEEKIRLLHRQRDSIEQKVKNGLAPETGLMEIDGRIQQSEANGFMISRNLRAAQLDLINAMGTDLVNGIRITELKELTGSSLKAPQKKPWEDTLTAKILAIDEQSDHLKLRQLEASHGPQVNLSTNLSASVRDVGVMDENKEGDILRRSSLELSIKYNIFDANQRRHEKSAFLAASRAQILERDQKKLELQSSFENFYQDLASFTAQNLANQKLLDMEKKRFEIVEREYRRGAQSYLDLVTALDTLVLAQQATDDDLIAEQIGLIRLHSLAGSIYEAIME